MPAATTTPKYWKEPFSSRASSRSFDERSPASRTRPAGRVPPRGSSARSLKGRRIIQSAGVSWYEAAAYAEFAGKRLPTYLHWRQASGSYLFGQVVAAMANFNGKSAVPAIAAQGSRRLRHLRPRGERQGVDLECDRRTADFVVGGAWNDPPYMAPNREPRSPLDRNATHGFRCVRDTAPLPAERSGADRSRRSRGRGRTSRSATNSMRLTGRCTRTIRGPLDAAGRGAPKTPSTGAPSACRSPRHTGTSGCRSIILLPKNAAPPYQPVIWFPGGYAFGLLPLERRSRRCTGCGYFDFIAAQRPRARVSDLSGHVPAVRRRRRISRATIR